MRPLDDYELATRLSYFLWSSVPDRELTLLAASKGNCRTRRSSKQQVRRMLGDQRVTDGLLEGFLCQWLQLDRLDRAIRTRNGTRPIFRTTSRELMKRELVLFADAILVEDRSILEFVDADWGIRLLSAGPALWRREFSRQEVAA